MTTTQAMRTRAASTARQIALRRLLNSNRLPPHQATGDPYADLALGAAKDALRSAGSGWYPESDVSASRHDGEAIQLDLIGFKRIDIRVNTNLLQTRATVLKASTEEDHELTLVWRGVRSLVRLFAGYFDHCPYDEWRHRRLEDAASWGAFGTYYPSESEQGVAVAVAALFERSVVSYRLTCAEGMAFVRGLAIEQKLNAHRPQMLSALFQQTQSILFPEAWGSAASVAPPAHDPTADALLADVLFIIFRARVRHAGGQLRARGRIRCPAPHEWSHRVADLAQLLAPYIKEIEDPPLEADNPFNPPAGASNARGTRPGPRGHSPGGGGPHPGREQGRGLRCAFEELDEYYSRQAQSLSVKDAGGESRAEDPELLPVGFLDYAPASLRDLVSGRIDWFRTRRVEPSPDHPAGLRLYRLSDPLEIPATASESASPDVPHLLLVVDSSGSMRFNPQMTGRSRGGYDVVLMACWGLFAFLKARALDDRVCVNALNFSGTTRSSGWHSAGSLEPVKRVLAAYQGGGTVLDAAAVRSAHETAPGRFLTMLITDGNVGNTPQTLAELRRTTEAGNGLVLLHVGAANAFTEGVRALGGCVHVVADARALVSLCIDVAQASYQPVRDL